MHLENGIRSDKLQNALELVLQHQEGLEISPNLGRRGLLQITQLTEQESAAASVSAKEVFEQLTSLPA